MTASTTLKTDKDINNYLFKRFTSVLPPHGSIRFLREHNMAGNPFCPAKLTDLYNFYLHWNSATYEFSDDELEKIRLDLHELVGDYLDQIAKNTLYTHMTDQITVPPEWRIKDSERFCDAVKNLHCTAEKIVNKYYQLISVCQIKLGDV